MNTATHNLEMDHTHILRLIDVMETIVTTKQFEIDDIKQIVSLIKNYADGLHHAKEENLLFPLLTQRGFSDQQGPVAVMLYEHTIGRNYVSGISKGIEDYEHGDENAANTIFTNMTGYISLLRNHIAKENNILFPMADRALTEKDQENLLKEFSKVENSNVCGGVLADCIQAIDKLEEIYVLQ